LLHSLHAAWGGKLNIIVHFPSAQPAHAHASDSFVKQSPRAIVPHVEASVCSTPDAHADGTSSSFSSVVGFSFATGGGGLEAQPTKHVIRTQPPNRIRTLISTSRRR
jgi:hypothetical protein